MLEQPFSKTPVQKCQHTKSSILQILRDKQSSYNQFLKFSTLILTTQTFQQIYNKTKISAHCLLIDLFYNHSSYTASSKSERKDRCVGPSI